MDVLKIEKLEELLQSRWAEILNCNTVLRIISQQVKDIKFKIINQDNIPPKQSKITVSFFKFCKFPDSDIEYFEICFEFTVPKDKGIVIGTVIYDLYLNGNFIFKKIYGTHFVPQTTSSVLSDLPLTSTTSSSKTIVSSSDSYCTPKL